MFGAVLMPSPTVLADPAGPTDYRTVVTSVEPTTDAITVTVEGGDAFIRLEVQPGHEVTVLGYGSEPYLRFRSDSTVDENQRSPAAFYNDGRYGGDVPSDVTASAALELPPEWMAVGSGGVWAWHDHRAHLMTTSPLIGMEPGDQLPPETIEILVDGDPVAINVVTTLQSPPAMWPAILGGALGACVIGLLVVSARRRSSRGQVSVVAVVVASGCFVTGCAQYLSLSSQTGPAMTWWLLPTLALGASIATASVKSSLWRGALLALAGLQLMVWAIPRRHGLTKAVLPTDMPFWLDRTITAAVLPAAAALFAVGAMTIFAPPQRPA